MLAVMLETMDDGPIQPNSSITPLSTSPCSDSNFSPKLDVSHLRENSFSENTGLDTSSSEDVDTNARANRFFSPNAVKILKKWFYENLDYPYPDESACTYLSKEAKISTKQVRKWFANKRVRSNRCFKQIYRNKKAIIVDRNNDIDGTPTRIQNDESPNVFCPINTSSPKAYEFPNQETNSFKDQPMSDNEECDKQLNPSNFLLDKSSLECEEIKKDAKSYNLLLQQMLAMSVLNPFFNPVFNIFQNQLGNQINYLATLFTMMKQAERKEEKDEIEKTKELDIETNKLNESSESSSSQAITNSVLTNSNCNSDSSIDKQSQKYKINYANVSELVN